MMSAASSPPQLVEMICADQRRRWQSGERVLATTYLDQYPTLVNEPDCAVEVIYNEILLREETGETPQLDEYLQRFPHLVSQLRRLFEVHEALEADSLESSLETSHPTRLTSARSRAALAARPVVPGYEILGELGRGGMGIVYQARHLALNRVVALKMIRTGAHADAEELARFHTEAEAAARVQYPHLVQIFDVGEVEGRPYLALEYVEGGTLAQKIAGTPQPPRQAARLLEILARAVHVAHQSGLIHRDLKPANVLLTPDSTPKITDFGLAKRLEGEPGASATGGDTQSGTILGTPSYMAPEQATGKRKEIGPAADIYALGVILYEMLTGRPPFLGESPLDTLQQVKMLEPVPPRRLQPKVPRDLETICLKCLQKEPSRRYANVLDLAEDLRRFQTGEPIQARPVSSAERLWRWCRRKPGVASLSAALLAAVVAGLIAATILWRKAEANFVDSQHNLQEANQREQERLLEHARAEKNLLEGRQAVYRSFVVLSEVELPRQSGTQPMQRRLLEEALAFFQNFLKQRPEDPELLADVAEARFRIGLIISKIGSGNQALSETLQASKDLEVVVRKTPGDKHRWHVLVTCYGLIGRLHMRAGDLSKARDSYSQARTMCNEALNQDPNNAPARRALVGNLHDLGQMFDETGDAKRAEECFQEMVALSRALLANEPDSFAYQNQLASAYHFLATLKKQTGSLGEALCYHHLALEIRQKVVVAHPLLPGPQWELSVSYQNLRNVLVSIGFLREAEAYSKLALAIQEKVARENPSLIDYQHKYGQGQTTHALLLSDTGRRKEAVLLAQRAIEIHEQLVKDNPNDLHLLDGLAVCHDNLGFVQRNLSLQDRDDAMLAASLQSHARARAILQPLVVLQPNVTKFRALLASSWAHTGSGERIRGDQKASEKAQEKARDLRLVLVRENPDVPKYKSDLAGSYHNLGRLYAETKDRSKTLTCHEEARRLRQELVVAHPGVLQYENELTTSYFNLGLYYTSIGALDEAEKAYRPAVAIQQRLVAINPDLIKWHSELALSAHNLGSGLMKPMRFEEAASFFALAVQHHKIALERVPDHEEYRRFLSGHYANLSVMKARLGLLPEAVEAIQERKKLWPSNPEQLYAAARDLTLCAAMVGPGRGPLTAEDEAERLKYADQAVQTLQEAIAAGFKDIKKLKEDPALKLLRSREDFKKLLTPHSLIDVPEARGL